MTFFCYNDINTQFDEKKGKKMKKILALLLVFATLASLTACGGGSLEETGTAEGTATAPVQNEKTKEDKTNYPTVPRESFLAELNALPIATGAMTEDQLRQLCLDFFRLQLTLPWVPNQTFSFDYVPGEKDTCNEGTLYGGMPYVERTYNSLYAFLTLCDENGVLDIKGMGKDAYKYIGNQCSGGSFWGWSRVSNSINWTGTHEIVASRGAIPLGPYTYDLSIDNHLSEPTHDICARNGEQVMFQSYAALEKADGLAQYRNGGHVMMAVSTHPVYKNGKIDGNESYVIVQEQVGGRSEMDVEGAGKILAQKGREQKHTYSFLLSRGYLPFTIAEFHGRDPIDAGKVSFSHEGQATVDQLTSAKLEANYAISHLTFTFFDKDGNETYEKSYYMRSDALAYSKVLNMADLGIVKSLFSKYITEGATARIDVQIGNGEFLCAWEGAITK